MRPRRFPLWTALAAVLVIALLAGSGVLSSGPPSRAQRAYAIESVLRCPSCEDLSVADSTAPTAVAVRATVSQLLSQGRTDRQIETYLEDRYGSSILLDPPARGWPLLVWLLPLVAAAAAVTVLSVHLLRRRARARHEAASRVAHGRSEDGADRARLEDRRRFLERSLADADAEYLAGDLAEQDYLRLRRRDLVSIAAVEEELRAAPVAGPRGVAVREPVPGPAGAPEPGPTRPVAADGAGTRRRWLVRGAVASFAAALVLAVSLFTAERLPGQTATGTVSMTESQRIAQDLDQAATLENGGELGQAASIYQSVLAGHPNNEVALAQLGWLEYQIGRSGNSTTLTDDGQAELERAAKLDPGDYAASLYLGTVLWQRDGNAAGAVGQYERFLADDPPAALLRQAAPELRQAYEQAGVPVPEQLAG